MRTLETLRDEMQAYHDDRSEAWQNSERASMMMQRIDALDSIINELDSLPD
jgi:hypothetical protein